MENPTFSDTIPQFFYRSILDHSPAAIFLGVPETGRIFYVNPAACNMFGYTHEEFLTMNRDDIIVVNEALKKGKEDRAIRGSFKGELICKRKNGEHFPCEVSSVVFIDDDGLLRSCNTIIDISTMKKTEEELRKSNERYKLATRASFDAIWDADLVNKTINWGEGFETLFGYKTGDHPSSANTWEDNIHPDDRERVLRKHNDILFNHPEQNFWTDEYRFIKADGSISYVIDRGLILRDGSGKPYRLVGAMQDISKTKYHEQLLALELQVYAISAQPGMVFKEVVKTLLEGLETLHPDMLSSVLLLNENQTIKHLYSPRLPQDYIRIIDGSTIGPAEGSCGTAMYLKEPVVVADIKNDKLWTNYREDALRFGLQACWSVPVIHSNGKIIGSFAIYYKEPKHPTEQEWHSILKVSNLLRVLMENHLAADEILASNERFKIVTEATHDMIWDWNLESGEIYRDPEGVKNVYGLETDEPLRQINGWITYVHPEDQQRIKGVIADILKAGNNKTFEVEYRFRNSKGEYNHVLDRGIVISNKEGKNKRMIGAAQNITDRKLLEKKLLDQELQKQKEISKAIIDTQEKERAEIGKELHDNINQVLTTTRLYLDLAISGSEKKTEFIAKSSANIQTIINEIRKISTSLMSPSLGDLGLTDSIVDLVESINITSKLKADFITDPGIESQLNEQQKLIVYRIIQEAVSNVIRHSEARSLLIHLASIDHKIQLTISDDGNGFDPNKQKRGSGLNNIQNRVYLFNGTLEINTSIGKGCELVINIPLQENSLEKN